jgi:two-component system sensor histidine kinase/response regulator
MSAMTPPVRLGRVKPMLLQAFFKGSPPTVHGNPYESATIGAMQQDLTYRSSTRRARFGARLLVAEDNPVNQDIAASMLNRMKCQVTLAANGAQAAQFAAETHFDLIFMDCEMPEMDGFAASRLIRQNLPRNLPIIAMTAHRSSDVQTACLDAGMDDVLSKPLTLDALGTMLCRWIGHLEIGAAEDHPHAMPATSVPAATAALDTGALTSISALSAPNGTALLNRLIERFSDSAPRLMAELRECSAKHDLGTVRTTAHSLKSASMALGASRLAALADTIEKAGHEKDPTTVASLVPLLGGEFETALTELRLFAGQTP